MSDPITYWTKFGAVAQAIGAAGTFAAVVASLIIAFKARKPLLKIRVGERIIIGPGPAYPPHMMFEVVNSGDRPVQIRSIGWQTGWLNRGPRWLKRVHAVQLTGGAVPWGAEPPYDLLPGMPQTSNASMENMLAHARERVASPIFTRDWPIFGRRQTRVRAYAYTADGYTILVKPEPALTEKLVAAEKEAAGN